MQQTADGGCAFAGYYFQNTVYTERAWLAKTDSAGNLLWDKIYGSDVQYASRYFCAFQQAKFVETSVLPVLKSAQANQSSIESVTSLVSPSAANIERAGFAVLGVVINPGDASGVDAFLFVDQLDHNER